MRQQTILAAALVAASVARAQGAPFYVAQFPDTQHYTYDAGRMLFFYGMAAQLRAMPTPPIYVTHVGDLTEYAWDIEFDRANAAMHLLDPIPWGVSIGNHDYDQGAKCTVAGHPYPCTSQWRRYRGPENFVNVAPSPAGPVGFVHLEYMPSDDSLDMAMSWMDANPTTPVVVTTHYWLDIDGARGRIGARLDGAGDNSPAETWRKLCETYPQVFLVLAGHVSGESFRSDTTILGTRVPQSLSNYQSDPYGGQGFLRFFGFSGSTLHVLTHSWEYQGLPPNRFGYFTAAMEDLHALPSRLAAMHIERLEPSADTFVAPCWGGIGSRGSWDLLWAAATGCQEHGMIRFEVPARAVGRAILTVTVEGHSTDGAGFQLRRMLRPWGEQQTWGELGGLVEGRDYSAQVDIASSTPLATGTINLDVTDAVRAWAAGAPNYGWCVLGLGESCGFRTREWHARAERPRLTVVE